MNMCQCENRKRFRLFHLEGVCSVPHLGMWFISLQQSQCYTHGSLCSKLPLVIFQGIFVQQDNRMMVKMTLKIIYVLYWGLVPTLGIFNLCYVVWDILVAAYRI